MKNIFLYLLYGYLGLFVAPSFAQTNDFLLNGGPATITYPIMGSVIQRNSSDNANVSFCGNVGYSYQQTNLYNYVLGLTELDPMTGAVKLINGSPRIITYNFNAASDIVSISSELGAFNKYINVPKGWWNAGFQIQRKDGTGGFVACTIKFGVGDTFIIAGQSNARGFPEVFDNGIVGYDTNLSNAQLPDAVRVIGNAERPANETYPTASPNDVQTLKLGGLPVFKGFEKLTLQKELTAEAAKIPNNDGTFSKLYDRPIFPLGLASWCWAPLGKQYVEQTGVPVQFFNVAVDGSSVNNWQPSSGNYNRLLSIIRTQANILGHKGILWHQGEADASNGMTETDYQTKLKSLVDGIQNDFDSNGSTWGALTWNISNVSFYTKWNGSTYDIFPSTSAIINAQNSVSFQTAIKKNGVATDGIGANLRSPTQKIHFHAGIHGTVASLWKNLSLWNNIPKAAMPAMARTQITQQSNGTYNVKVLPDFPISEYRWIKNEDDITIATTDTYNVPANSSTKDIFTCFVKPTGKNYWLIAPPFVGPNNEDRNPFIFVPVPPLAFSKQQEAKVFTLSAKNMTWNSAVTDPSWASIIQNSTGGHGNTEVKVQVTTNTGSSSRTNSIVFTGTSPTGQTMSQTLTITQSATTGCTQTNLSSLTPSSESFSYTGKRNNLNISGQTLMVGGYQTNNGVGVHANSTLVYPLNGQYSTFSGSVGRDDAADNCGCGTMKLQFIIKADGATLFTSNLLGTADGKQAFSVNVAGKNNVELIVNDGGDQPWGDHADWLDAILYCGTPTTCTTAPPVPTNVNSSPQTIGSGGNSTLSATCATGVVVWNTGQTANSITVSPTITTSYNAKCVSGSCPVSNTVSVGVTVNSSGCSGFANGTVMGTWTVTGQPLVARFFHGQYWLTQRAGTNPDVFVVRGSGMLQRSDVSLSNGSYYNMVNCFAWTYSDYGSLQNPPSTTFPTPSGYSLSYSQDGTMIYTANSGGGSGSGCTDTFVSNNWASATIGDGSGPKIGQNYQGGTMNINGTTYSQGIGTHAGSEIVYNLGSHSYANFKASVGRDVSSYNCNCGGQTIVFKVYNHSTGALIGSSTNNPVTKTINQSASDMVVPISGVSSIRLVVEDGGDQIWGDWANWGKARFTCAGSNFREAAITPEEWFWVSPNPNDGKFIAKVNLKIPQSVQLYLSDIKGNIIKEYSFVGVEGINNFEINIQDKITIESIYNIRCQAGEVSDSKRVIIEK